ncbi:MAG: DUF2868 domain-containing protein [Phycisphaerales bacterium]|nr:MAG: DUF2868 domain-containing protein [Phycisphaerales bacterium]
MPVMATAAPADSKMSSTASPPSGPDGNDDRTRLTYRDRFSAEVVLECDRLAESRISPEELDDARRTGGPLESRLVALARRRAASLHTDAGIHQVRRAMLLLLVIGLLLAALLGAGTVRTSLIAAGEGRINVFVVIGAILGVQTFLLLLWLLAIIAAAVRAHRRESPGSPAHDDPLPLSLGRALLGLSRFILKRLGSSPALHAATNIMLRHASHGALGRWSLSAVSHAIWFSFNVGVLLTLVVLLSTRQYVFTWETTILSEREYVNLTQMIGAIPDALGIAVPDEELIIASQWTGDRTVGPQVAEAATAWAGFLAGAIVVYGFAPRVLLLGLSLSLRRTAQNRYRIDLNAPAVQRLKRELMPPERPLGVVDPAEAESPVPPRRAMSESTPRPAGPPAILGFELAQPPTPWPPALHGVNWQDLGLVDSRDDQQRVLETLASSESTPNPLCLVVDLTNTPDRGIVRFLTQLQSAIGAQPHVIFTGGQHLRDRASDAEAALQRLEDWHHVVRQAGLEKQQMHEADLAHLTEASRRKLAAGLRSDHPDQKTATSDDRPRHIEDAFSTIAETAARWIESQSAPDTRQVTELHRMIAERYAVHHNSGNVLRNVMSGAGSIDSIDELKDRMQTSAQQMLTRLPARLQRNANWAAAGAVSGALGCLAASLLISPVAIGALPIWSTLGGGVSAIAGEFLRRDSETTPTAAPDSDDWAQNITAGVRAGVLTTLTFELQSRDEAVITRVLDQTLQDLPELDSEHNELSRTTVRHWLDTVRHRFDLALARQPIDPGDRA